MAAIGAIEIQLLADVARLRADMGSASSIVSGAAGKMTDAFGVAKGALAALGVGLSAAGFASWIKSGIDAADSMKNFSQRTGVAVRDVAGLQLAFKQGGIESEALGTAMSRMTRNMATGADAFKTLGVATHNTDGTMRGAKEVLYDTAEALASVQGNSERVALATEVFGKAGAALLPVFADGAEGLREMADMADKLGLSMDGEAAEAADKFNDTLELVGLSTQGVARQVGAQLLPALNGIVGAFLNFITEGDRVKKMAEFIATGLKMLYSAGVALVEIFSAVGKTVGAAIAQIVAVMSGDLKGAIAIGKEWAADMKGDWSKAIKNIGSAWDESSNETVAALAKTTRVMRDVKVATDAQKEADKGLASQRKQDAKDFEKQQKDKEKLIKDEIDLQSKRAIAAIASYEKEQQAVDDSITKAGEMVAAIKSETAALTMSNTEREISNALLALEKAGLEKGTYAYDLYAQAIRDAILNKAAVAESIEQSKQIADNWNKLTEQIGQGLTDSLFRAFEAGKGFFSTLWDGIVNTFKTTAMRLIVNAVINPVNAAVGSLLGGGSSLASAATGVGGGGGILELLSGVGGLFGQFGTAAGYGASALFGGTGLTALSGAGGMLGAGNLAGGLGMGLGVLGPIAAGAAGLYALYNAFKKERTPHTGGSAMSTESGTTYGDYGMVGYGTRADYSDPVAKTLGGFTSATANLLNTLSRATGGRGGYSVGGAYADDSSRDAAWGDFMIRSGGNALVDWRAANGGRRQFADGEQGLKDYVTAMARSTRGVIDQMNLPQWARSIAKELSAAPTAEELGATVQKIVDMGKAISYASENLVDYGGVFLSIANASDDAKASLIGLMGGIEGLMQAANSFVGTYYTKEEQSSITARQVLGALQGAGIDVNGLNTLAEYRSLTESIPVTSGNAPKIAALLQNASAFASLVETFNKTGMDLTYLASLAPNVAYLQAATNPATAGGTTPGTGGATTDTTSQSLTAPATNASMAEVREEIEEMADMVRDAIDLVRTTFAPILTSIATNSASTQRILTGWSDDDAVLTRAAP